MQHGANLTRTPRGAWILKPREYRELSLSRRESLKIQGIDIGDPGFFPAYRYQPEIPLAASTR